MLKNLLTRNFNNLKLFIKNKLSYLSSNSIYLGIVKGINLPILPQGLYNFYNHIFVRILRVIGGTCLIIIVTKSISVFPNELHFIINIIGLLQSIQILLISIIKIIYGLYTLIYRRDKFEVKK